MTMKTRSLLVVVLVLVVLIQLAAASGSGKKTTKKVDRRCHSGDKAALLAVKSALGNPYHFGHLGTHPFRHCQALQPFSPHHLMDWGISFNLSSTVAAMPDQLYFSHNAIYGGIPAQVANPTNLQFFNVSYNRLYGQIPAGDNMSRCDVFSFQHNKMQLPTV
ncbi:hypothetical protein PR202_gb25259 [Eleusine coracana subsp. coracana]|uniref:Uncharacterized protein n=1 Tax=Eleusine coracana subsp. coracana TaxID=191504 RepID=A0AAV5FKS5_ELECO|nr:hypothetical protein PR202_gb25259 [Eleusine coracana subsp. coracana]